MTSDDGTKALAGEIDRILASLDARTALYAKHLPTGQEVAIRDDEPMNPLSVIKIPIMLLAYRDAEAGAIDLDERYTLRREDMRRGTGLLQTFAHGLQPTYRDLVTQMIVTSDNTATDILIDRLGLDRVNDMLVRLGHTDTVLQATTGDLFRRLLELIDDAGRELAPEEVYDRGVPRSAEFRSATPSPANLDSPTEDPIFNFVADPREWLGRTTARDTGRLLEELVEGRLAGELSTNSMLQTLQEQFYTSRLPRRIEGRVPIGHKTGDWPPIAANDVGVLFGADGPIVIALFMTHNRGSFTALEEAHGAIAEAILTAWHHPA